ncbi:MAG TPA: hypothetical protein VE687_07770, partial [Stellaceae bacterium]|nr:hypothetical protein [Stellaceae bacterium]
PQTPTTKILAVDTFAPGTDMSQVQRILPTEVRETAQLYLDGKIGQWYSLEDRPGVVFILNMTDTQGSARHAGRAATRQSPSDDVPAHADRSAQSPPPAAGTGCSALTVQLKKLA